MESRLKLTPKENDIILLRSKLALACEMITLNARTSIVSAVCQISKRSALQLHKEIHGTIPKKGLLPYDPYWVIKTPENCLHASLFYRIVQNITVNIKDNKSDNLFTATIFLTAYKVYLQTMTKTKKELFSINRAWNVGQQIKNSDIHGISCPRCHSGYLAIKNYPQPFQLCPLCDVTVDCSGRQRWAQSKGVTVNRLVRKKQNEMNSTSWQKDRLYGSAQATV
jgi:hypothetical protein